MAWTSGTANNYLHLLELLRNYLSANGYTILHFSTTQFYCKGPGLEGLDEIYWGIDTFENSGTGHWNWELAGSVSYKEGRGGISHPGGNRGHYMFLWNQAIPYWFAVNGRRAIILVKVGTVFQMAYMGLGLPIGTFEQYPYPLVIGGCSSSRTSNYSSTGATNTLFFSTNTGDNGTAGATQGRFLVPQGVWVGMSNTGSNFNMICQAGRNLTQNFRANIVPALDGTYLVEEIVLPVRLRPTYNLAETAMLKLDGVFKTSGKNNSAENIISVGGSSYLVFPDTYRAAAGDYFALKME